jgi:type III pantothenate kinase
MESDRPLLAFDVGNTSVKCALLAEPGWQSLSRVPTAPVKTLAERLAAALTQVPEAAACVASSVHPPADKAVEALCVRLGLPAPRFFGRDIAIPLRTALREPQKVGSDRLLLALGALAVCRPPCVVVGAGTAITCDLLDTAGVFRGGSIAPGIGLCAAALHRATALLPEVRLAETPLVPGRDTQEAVRAGVYWSCAGGVLALLERYEETAGRVGIPVVCTGTDAPLLLPALPAGTLHEPDLIFRGMAVALETGGRQGKERL